MKLALFFLSLPLLAQYTMGDAGIVHISPTHGMFVTADGIFKGTSVGTLFQLTNGYTSGNVMKATFFASDVVADGSYNQWWGSDGSGAFKFPVGAANMYTSWYRPLGLPKLVVKKIGLNSSSEPVVAFRLGNNARWNAGPLTWTASTSTTAHNVNAFTLNASNNILAIKQQSGIDVSTDGGSTWTAYRASINGLIFSLCRDAFNNIVVGSEDGGFYRSFDDGLTFTQLGPAGGAVTFVLHNAAGCTMAANGRIVGTSSSGQTISMSYSPTEASTPPVVPTDVPNTWVASTCVSCSWQGLAKKMVTIPTSNDIYAADGYYGAVRSTDNGATWLPVGTANGLPAWATNGQSLIYQPADGKLYLGTESGGVFRTTGVVNGVSGPAITWESIAGPYYGQSQSLVELAGMLFVSTKGNGIFRSMDGGYNWQAANTGLTNLFQLWLTVHPLTKALWACSQSFPRHTLQDARAYLGGGCWTSTNYGVSWSTVSMTGITANAGPNQVVFAANGDAYAWVKNDHFYTLPYGGSTWTALTDLPSSDIRQMVQLLIDSGSRLFAVSGIGRSYVSTNLGVSWTLLPVVNSPVRGYIDSSDNVYMLNLTGIEKSTNHGVSFSAIAGLPSRRYASMEISGANWLLGTEDGQYGVGTIVISTNSGSTFSTATVTQADNPGVVTLDTFATARNNGQGNPLISTYLGEDPNQTYTISGSALNVVGATAGCSSDCGIYWHILPQGTSGYTWLAPCLLATAGCGYLQHWPMTTPWDPKMNRLSMDVTCTTAVAARGDGTENLQLGTYIRDRTSADPTDQGAHYYHFADGDYPANKKVTQVFNAHPSHKVAMSGSFNWPDDPELAAGTLTYSYFDAMTRFYWDTQNTGWSGKACSFSNINISRQEDEPNEYVSGITVTHNGTAYKMALFGAKNDTSTFSFYRSTTSMHLNGLSSGTLIGTVTYAAGGNDYAGVYSSATMAVLPTVYIAIRPNVAVLTATNATPIVVGFKADPMFKNGDQVTITGVGGNTAANGTRYVSLVAASLGVSGNRTGATYALYSDPALATAVAGNGAYTSGGTVTATNDFTNFSEVLYTSSGGGGTAPTITTTCPLTSGTVGVPYSQTMTATGDTPITWDISVGSPPAGLALSSGGVMSGTPTTVSSPSFTLRATNSVGLNTLSCSMSIVAATQAMGTRSGKAARSPTAKH